MPVTAIPTHLAEKILTTRHTAIKAAALAAVV
jgi:hypothetical protein